MKDDAHPTKRYGGQGNVHELLTPEMRQQVVQLKEQLEDYVGRLDTVCHNLDLINNAIYRAYEIAECLLKDDPFAAWDTQSKVRSQPLTRREDRMSCRIGMGVLSAPGLIDESIFAFARTPARTDKRAA